MAPFLTEAVEATKGQKNLNGGSGINVHYSGSQSASVIVRFVKTSALQMFTHKLQIYYYIQMLLLHMKMCKRFISR